MFFGSRGKGPRRYLRVDSVKFTYRFKFCAGRFKPLPALDCDLEFSPDYAYVVDCAVHFGIDPLAIERDLLTDKFKVIGCQHGGFPPLCFRVYSVVKDRPCVLPSHWRENLGFGSFLASPQSLPFFGPCLSFASTVESTHSL